MLSLRIPYFDLKNLYYSNQLCNMKLIDDNTLIIHNADKVLMLKQFGQKFVFHCSESDFFDVWYKFLSLDEAYNVQIRPIKDLHILNPSEFNYYSNVRPLLIPLELVLLHLPLLDGKFIGYNFRSVLSEFNKGLGTKREISILNFGKVAHYDMPPIKDIHKLDLSKMYLSTEKKNLLCKISEACENIDLLEAQKLTTQVALAYIKSHFDFLSDEQIAHIMLSSYRDYSFCPEYYLRRSVKTLFHIETNAFREWYDTDLKTNIGLLGLMLTAKYNAE